MIIASNVRSDPSSTWTPTTISGRDAPCRSLAARSSVPTREASNGRHRPVRSTTVAVRAHFRFSSSKAVRANSRVLNTHPSDRAPRSRNRATERRQVSIHRAGEAERSRTGLNSGGQDSGRAGLSTGGRAESEQRRRD